MRKVKLMHCADIHLDMPFTSLGHESGRSSIRREDLKRVFQRIADTAAQEKADILLIAGDLYEHEYVRDSTINFINDRFYDISHIKVVIVPGNHDPYVENSFYRRRKWSPNVHILTGDPPYKILNDVGICIYGSSFKDFYQDKSSFADLKELEEDYVNIFLAHGTIEFSFDRGAYNPMTVESLDSLGMDYIALGHFHNRIEGMGARRNIFNPGSPEPLGFDETGDHGAFAATVVKSGSKAEIKDFRFIKLNERFYENIEIDVTGCNADDIIVNKISDAFCGRDCTSGLFNITLKGYIEPGFKINTSYIQSSIEKSFFYTRIKDETSIDYDFDEMMREPGLRGLFVRKAFSLIDRTGDDREKRLLMKAVYYGLEALEQGKVDIAEDR